MHLFPRVCGYSEFPFIRSVDISPVTTSMNASLHMHAQTLSLLALQRSTPNLPFQLIAPGRTFLKRGSLIQLERGSFLKEHDFLLFSDCLLWIANLDKGDSEATERWDRQVLKAGLSSRIMMVRSRSRSEAELSALRSRAQAGGSGDGCSQPVSPTRSSPSAPPSRYIVNPTRTKKRQASSTSCDERWWFKGKVELVDLEIVVTPSTEDREECRLEVWSPEGSFAVYAGKPSRSHFLPSLTSVSVASERERDEWSTAIRNAKAALLASLNVTHPNSTLSSSASTNHLRRTLQALPHLPGDERNGPRRGRVEHFVPAVWIPDGRTESCMRCGRPFGWRRRRHHCRLCGRCVCASCSGSVCWFRERFTDPTKTVLCRSSTYLIQMLRNLGNPHAPVMRVMKRCFRCSRPPTLPIMRPRPQLSRYLVSPPGSRPQLSRSFAHLRYSWPSMGGAQIVNSRA
jgi:FYVE, RhoGEF and PH domain containing 5/6